MGRKKPRQEPAPDSQYTTPVWRLSSMDLEGPFGWGNLTESKLRDIRSKLAGFESNTWHEILVRDSHRSHTVLVERLSPKAKKRLREIDMDDIDALVSLRLSGPERVWGIRTAGIFDLLWWDPQHLVCPSKRR